MLDVPRVMEMLQDRDLYIVELGLVDIELKVTACGSIVQHEGEGSGSCRSVCMVSV